MKHIALLVFLAMPALAFSQADNNVVNPPVASTPPVTGSAPAPERALTNEDVLKLCGLGLGDQVVLAKIRQAAHVDFRLDADSLGQLKAGGASADVITAMLNRSSGTDGSSPATVPASPTTIVVNPGIGIVPSTPVVFSEGSVRMRTTDGERDLRSSAGSIGTTYAYITVLIYCDYPGLTASTRTKDTKPSFLVSTQQSPVGRYFLVKAKKNDGDNNRSVKMGKAGFIGYKGMGAPDSDWVIPTDVVEERPGFWRVTPKRPLPKGEYGMWVRSNDMFDFGID